MIADTKIHTSELASVNAIFGGADSTTIAGGGDSLRLMLRMAGMKVLENEKPHTSGCIASSSATIVDNAVGRAAPKIGRSVCVMNFRALLLYCLVLKQLS